MGEARTAADYSNGALRHMPPRDDLRILELADGSAWELWLERHHAASPGVWLKPAKKGAIRALGVADPVQERVAAVS